MQISEKHLPLHRVFHSIRFKVNKGWSTAVLLFFYPSLNGTMCGNGCTVRANDRMIPLILVFPVRRLSVFFLGERCSIL